MMVFVDLDVCVELGMIVLKSVDVGIVVGAAVVVVVAVVVVDVVVVAAFPVTTHTQPIQAVWLTIIIV